MIVTMKFNFGWRNGRATKIDSEEADLFDIMDHYPGEIPDKWKDKVYNQDEFTTHLLAAGEESWWL